MTDISNEELVKSAISRDLQNVTNYAEYLKLGDDTLDRDGVVIIETYQLKNGKACFIVRLLGPVFGLDARGRTPSGLIVLDKAELHQVVQRCRDTWLQEVVQREWPEGWLRRSDLWFQERVKQPSAVLDEIAPKIAQAGADLFKVLFEDGDDIVDVGKLLRKATAQKDLTLTFYSNDFFVPWSMIYTGAPITPDSPPVKESFWGYRHVIEHSTDKFHPSSRIESPDGKLKLGLCYNKGDFRINDQVALQLRELKTRNDLVVFPRSTDSDVELLFKSKPYPDGVTQFYVHCECSGSTAVPYIAPPHIRVENKDIRASDFMAWIPKKLSPEPFFLFNACEGGQMVTLFYESFALELLRRDAKGLIGPQVQIPMVFASAYTKRFLEELFAATQPPNRVGHIVRRLAQEFWDTQNNPLGLVYSLYRGADCFFSAAGRA